MYHFSLRRITIFCLCLCLFVAAMAQTRRHSLEQKRQMILERMKETVSKIQEMTQTKRQTERSHAAIQENIERKEANISSVNEQINNSSESLLRSYEVIESLNEDLAQMRISYGEVMRKTFRNQLNHNLLAFLLASDNFNGLSQRMHYAKQLDRIRTRQVRIIKATQMALKEKTSRLEKKIEKKEQTLGVIEDQKEVLTEKLTLEKDKLLGLRQKERGLKHDLKIQERQAERLNKAIEAVIRAEIVERRRVMQESANAIAEYRSNNKTIRERRKMKRTQPVEEESLSRTSAEPTLKETPEVQALSNNFKSNKGKLPWPVRNAAVVSGFGKQAHPTLRGVFTTNNGIDIRTEAQTEVSAVAQGRVAAVQFVVGYDYLVILQHGNFYTVYSHLDKVFVKRDDSVTFKQTIGKISGDKVHFEVWNNNNRENPKSWLAK